MRLLLTALLLATACHARGSIDEAAAPTPVLEVPLQQAAPAGGPSTAVPSSGACDAAEPCQSDADCACGRDEDGRCAVGPAACIDTSDPCPDFCSGITGRMVTVCREGQCAQSHP